jgi:hypothetical protein
MSKEIVKTEENTVAIEMPTKADVNKVNRMHDKTVSGTIKMIETYREIGAMLAPMLEAVKALKPTIPVVDKDVVDENGEYVVKDVKLTVREWIEGCEPCDKFPEGAPANLHFSRTMAYKYIQLDADWEHLELADEMPTSLNDALKKAKNVKDGNEDENEGTTKAKKSPVEIAIKQAENLSNALSNLETEEDVKALEGSMRALAAQYGDLWKTLVKEAA